jgi:pimeloyl-ACP methyl ester carboxylesterase
MDNIMPFIRASASGLAEERPCVIALHCSGGSGRQWRHLVQALGPGFNVIAPDLIGSGGGSQWSGAHRFRLTHEAQRIVSLIDRLGVPVHLVGHSYGGGAALRVALERPHRVTSLSLYEPTPFRVLGSMGPDGRRALSEILAVANGITAAVLAGDHRVGARRFVDYWNGVGTYSALKPEAQTDIARFMPQGVLHFRALFDERTSLVAYRRLGLPLRILCGEASPQPARLVAYGLARAMNPGALRMVQGAGHMGPLTHAMQVASEIAGHIEAVELAMHGVRQPRNQAA